MIYYANPATEPIRDAINRGEFGCITTPAQGNKTFPNEWDVIADNGCFSDRWDATKWATWLRDQSRAMRFAVCPDVFAPDGQECHAATLGRWHLYSGLIERAGFVPAFVCQVGSSPCNVPDDASVLFLGGTTEWKLGPVAASIVARHRSDRWVHMGRVNSLRRLRYAAEIGCHSADGTFLTFAPDQNLPRLRVWLESLESSPTLWAGCSQITKPTVEGNTT